MPVGAVAAGQAARLTLQVELPLGIVTAVLAAPDLLHPPIRRPA